MTFLTGTSPGSVRVPGLCCLPCISQSLGGCEDCVTPSVSPMHALSNPHSFQMLLFISLVLIKYRTKAI